MWEIKIIFCALLATLVRGVPHEAPCSRGVPHEARRTRRRVVKLKEFSYLSRQLRELTVKSKTQFSNPEVEDTDPPPPPS